MSVARDSICNVPQDATRVHASCCKHRRVPTHTARRASSTCWACRMRERQPASSVVALPFVAQRKPARECLSCEGAGDAQVFCFRIPLRALQSCLRESSLAASLARPWANARPLAWTSYAGQSRDARVNVRCAAVLTCGEVPTEVANDRCAAYVISRALALQPHCQHACSVSR